MASKPEDRLISWEEVKKHNSASSLWVVIDGKVYDITEFVKEHPGGEEILLEHGGIDATTDFEDVGHSSDARELKKRYLIGTVTDKPVPSPPQVCCGLSCQGWLLPAAVIVGLLGIGIIVAYRLRK